MGKNLLLDVRGPVPYWIGQIGRFVQLLISAFYFLLPLA